jgi:hypothetical protein
MSWMVTKLCISITRGHDLQTTVDHCYRIQSGSSVWSLQWVSRKCKIGYWKEKIPQRYSVLYAVHIHWFQRIQAWSTSNSCRWIKLRTRLVASLAMMPAKNFWKGNWRFFFVKYCYLSPHSIQTMTGQNNREQEYTNWWKLHLDTKKKLFTPSTNSNPVNRVSLMHPGAPVHEEFIFKHRYS